VPSPLNQAAGGGQRSFPHSPTLSRNDLSSLLIPGNRSLAGCFLGLSTMGQNLPRPPTQERHRSLDRLGWLRLEPVRRGEASKSDTGARPVGLAPVGTG
jgi:hypothetical protein